MVLWSLIQTQCDACEASLATLQRDCKWGKTRLGVLIHPTPTPKSFCRRQITLFFLKSRRHWRGLDLLNSRSHSTVDHCKSHQSTPTDTTLVPKHGRHFYPSGFCNCSSRGPLSLEPIPGSMTGSCQSITKLTCTQPHTLSHLETPIHLTVCPWITGVKGFKPLEVGDGSAPHWPSSPPRFFFMYPPALHLSCRVSLTNC